MSEVEITVVINVHQEPTKWLERCLASITKQIDAPSFEVIIVADRPSKEVLHWAAGQPEATFIHVDNGDLGLSRNDAVKQASGRYVAFMDGDDLAGCKWLRQAYDYCRSFRETSPSDKQEDVVVHTEQMVMFQAENFMHRCVGDDSPEFDARDLDAWNLWSALAFAPKSVFERFPYEAAKDGWGYEDFHFNVRTLGAGIAHRVAPGSMHAIRIKRDNTSLAHRTMNQVAVIRKMDLYDRRDLAKAATPPQEVHNLPPEVHQQTLFLHHEIGELQLAIHPQMTIRQYPRSQTFEEQATLRDAIGDAKHVVLVHAMRAGGAEKYAIDWAKATGAVIIETDPEDRPGVWLQRAQDAGVKVITWRPLNPELIERDKVFAFRRALIQADLESILVCNSPLGWRMVHENAQVLAKRVYAASFAVIPHGHGFTICPPLFMKNNPPNFAIVTDNEQHATKLRNYLGLRVEVIKPKVVYDGPSKKSRLEKDRYRILWAGRGTMEKRPDVLPSLAAALEGQADIHVWGNVQPMNATENLKYRGPFDGFDKIDGSYDCYLMTSMFEGMPNTALEAVLAELPVIGPKVGGLPEVATATYDKYDPLTLSAQILAVCKAKKDNTEASLKVIAWANEYDGRVKALAGIFNPREHGCDCNWDRGGVCGICAGFRPSDFAVAQ